MSIEISKELLSEVFTQEVNFIKYVANNTYEVHFKNPIRLKYQIINIYELAHKCKEWASSKGYHIYSHNKGCYIHYNIASFKAGSEPEAIFKACQWILGNKDKQ